MRRETKLSSPTSRTTHNALEEVENEIVAFSRERERYQYLLTEVSASQRALDLSTELYLGGLKNFLATFWMHNAPL